MRRVALWVVGVLALAFALVGCADVLGIETFGTQKPDASTDLPDATQDGPPSGGFDATGPSDGSPVGTDGGLDDGDDGGGPTAPPCTAGGACNAGACQSGEWACSEAGAICTSMGPIEAGAACIPSPDAGATDGGTYVCNGPSCVECNAGQDCSDPDAGSCAKRSLDCSSGTPQCVDAGNLPEGESCGGANYCYGGVCSACKSGAACSPNGPGSNPCHTGITSCTGGVATCAEQTTTAAAAGTACTTSGGASGVCDGNSTCVACSQGATCTPGGNTCKSGTETCSGGFACSAGSNINEGLPCGSGEICSSGTCVACNPSSCPNGCCSATGCVATTAQTPTSCGNSGGTCGDCPTPANGSPTCNGVCGITCNTNYVAYSGSCVACTPGMACTANTCQTGTLSCTNGSPPTCTPTTSVNNGKTCGTGEVCSNGACVTCNATSCPSGCCDTNGCVTSQSTLECGKGGAACGGCPTPANGSPTCTGGTCGITCSANYISFNGTCVACTEGAACTANTCQTGTASCSSGSAPTCTPTTSVNNGKTCGTGEICSNGACVACNATSCPSGCCDGNGCVTAQSTSECGTGTGGGACRTCPGPTSGSGSAVCSGNNCGDSCSSGSHLCGTACASNTSPSTCGSSCTACSGANVAAAGCSGTACTVATCSANYGDCNGSFSDGCEASLQTDDANCGSCGHGCGAGGCSAGKCEYWTLYNQGPGDVECFASDGTNVAWVDFFYGAFSQTLASASATTISTQTDVSCYSMAVANGKAFFTSTASAGTSIWEYTLGSPNTLGQLQLAIGSTTSGGTTTSTRPFGLAVNPTATDAYFMVETEVSSSAGTTYTWNPEHCVLGGSCVALSPPVSAPSSAGTYVLWVNGYVFWSLNGTLTRYQQSSNTTSTVSNVAASIFTDGKSIFWQSGTEIESLNPSTMGVTGVVAIPSGYTMVATDGLYAYSVSSTAGPSDEPVTATPFGPTATLQLNYIDPDNGMITAGGYLIWGYVDDGPSNTLQAQRFP